MAEQQHVWGPWIDVAGMPGTQERRCIRCGEAQRRRVQIPGMSGLQSRRELRAELIALATIHGVLALLLWFAPMRLVVTPTNLNVFRIMPDVISVDLARLLWGVAFLGCSAGLSALVWRHGLAEQMAAVAAVGFVNGLWLAAYALPLLTGRGSLIGTVVFTTLLAWPGFVIYRVAHWTGE